MKERKVLVIGAGGQLGKCLQKLKNKALFEFARRANFDICDENQVEQHLSSGQFDYCVNCAAFTAVDLAEKHSEEAFAVNAKAVGCLARLCEKYGIVLIHISTDYVFDGTQTTPYKVSDSTNPINVYGASKLEGEQLIANNIQKYYILRSCWLYSEFEGNFYTTISKKLETEEALFVVNDQIGRPTNANDLAKVIVHLILSGKEPYGLHHFAGDEIMSWYDFALKIRQGRGMQVPIYPVDSNHYTAAAKRPLHSVLERTIYKP